MYCVHAIAGFSPVTSTPFTGSSSNSHTNPVAACIADGIGRGPTAGVGVVIAEAESHEAEVAVMQAACEAERDDKVGVAVRDDPTERVILDILYHVAACVGNNSQAPHLIVEEISGESIITTYGKGVRSLSS